MDIIKFLDSMLCSAYYQLTDEQLSALCDELIGRFKNYAIEYSEYGNLIYGAMVMLYGDYGTSPRTGWFDNPDDAMRCAEYVQNLKERLQGE